MDIEKEQLSIGLLKALQKVGEMNEMKISFSLDDFDREIVIFENEKLLIIEYADN